MVLFALEAIWSRHTQYTNNRRHNDKIKVFHPISLSLTLSLSLPLSLSVVVKKLTYGSIDSISRLLLNVFVYQSYDIMFKNMNITVNNVFKFVYLVVIQNKYGGIGAIFEEFCVSRR